MWLNGTEVLPVNTYLKENTAWTPPEWTRGIFASSASADTYGFGVTLWELASRGAVPPQPGGTPPPVDDSWDLPYKVLIAWCCHEEPDRRPYMHHVYAILDAYWKHLKSSRKHPKGVTNADDVLRLMLRHHGIDMLPTHRQMCGLVEHALKGKGATVKTDGTDTREKRRTPKQAELSSSLSLQQEEERLAKRLQEMKERDERQSKDKEKEGEKEQDQQVRPSDPVSSGGSVPDSVSLQETHNAFQYAGAMVPKDD